jgi:superoxide reductase
MQKTEIYRCGVCGNMVEVVSVGGGTLTCCGQKMNHVEENTTDAAVEKHVPVVEQSDGQVKVTVGSVIHPMLENHYIQFIDVVTATRTLRQYLKAGDQPVAVFNVNEPVVSVREYCNLHGLWAKK